MKNVPLLVFKSSDYKSVGDTTHPTCGCKSSAAAAAWWQRAPFFLLRYVKCFASGSISKHTGEQRDYMCGGCCFCTCLITMSVLYLCVEWTVHYWIQNDPSHCVSTVPPSPDDAPYLLEPFNDFYVHFKKCPNSSC